MTSIEIAFRLLRFTKFRDFDAMTADEKLSLIDAINGGLQKWNSLAPNWLKISPSGTATLRASVTLPLVVNAWSSTATFPGAPSTDDFISGSTYADLIGCSVLLTGTSKLNQFIASSSSTALILRDRYEGASAISSAIIYRDAIAFSDQGPFGSTGSPIVISSPPRLDGKPMELLPEWNIEPMRTASIGKPRFYWIDTLPDPVRHTATAGGFRQALRVWPLPDQSYEIAWTQEAGPVRLNILNLIRPIFLSVPEWTNESILMPFIVEALSNYPVFAGDPNKVAASARLAEQTMARIPQTNQPTINHVGTPRGY